MSAEQFDGVIGVMANSSKEISLLVEALVKAHADFSPVEKDAEIVSRYFDKASGQYIQRTRRYATLDSILKSVKPALIKHGLAVVQRRLPAQDNMHGMETILLHVSGQWISEQSFMPIATSQEGPQAVGATITYHRRYSLASMLCVAPDEDTDAEPSMDHPVQAPAVQAPAKERSEPKVPPQQKEAIDEERDKAARNMFSMFKNVLGISGSDEETRAKRHRVAKAIVGDFHSMRDLTTAQMTEIVKAVQSDTNYWLKVAEGVVEPQADPFLVE